MKKDRMIAKAMFNAYRMITWSAALLVGFVVMGGAVILLGNIGLSFPAFLAAMIPVVFVDVVIVVGLQYWLMQLCIACTLKVMKNNEG